jgi:hypothetical protein
MASLMQLACTGAAVALQSVLKNCLPMPSRDGSHAHQQGVHDNLCGTKQAMLQEQGYVRRAFVARLCRGFQGRPQRHPPRSALAPGEKGAARRIPWRHGGSASR